MDEEEERVVAATGGSHACTPRMDGITAIVTPTRFRDLKEERSLWKILHPTSILVRCVLGGSDCRCICSRRLVAYPARIGRWVRFVGHFAMVEHWRIRLNGR